MNPVDVITKLFSVNPGAAKFLLGGMAVLASAAIVLSWRIDTAEAVRIAMYILGFAALVVIGSNFPGRISRLAAWLMFGLFSIFAILFTTQFLCSSCLYPPVPNAGCLLKPLEQECGISLAPTETAETGSVAPADPETPVSTSVPVESPPVLAENLPVVAASPARAPVSTIETIVTAEALEAEALVTRGLQADATNSPTRGLNAAGANSTVYIHFAGSFTRKEIVALAAELGNSGWKVQGKEQGGERLVSAYGLSEVRFFNQQDEGAARALAKVLNGLKLGARTVALRNLSNSKFKAAPGQLEVWISN